jgi:hypothetical protein
MPGFVKFIGVAGEPVYVNADRTCAVGLDGKETVIYMSGGGPDDCFYVAETPEDAVKMLESVDVRDC